MHSYYFGRLVHNSLALVASETYSFCRRSNALTSSEYSNLSTLNENGLSADNVILPSAAIEGLKPIQVTVMKETVFTVNQNTRLAGELLRSTAISLFELKQNLVNKQWISFLKSGALPIPEKQARDLTAAWEGWLRDSDVTDGDLVGIGSRTMAKIKALEPEVKKKAIKKIKSGERLREKAISEMGGRVIATNSSGLKGHIDKLQQENTSLKEENGLLKKRIKELEKVAK